MSKATMEDLKKRILDDLNVLSYKDVARGWVSVEDKLPNEHNEVGSDNFVLVVNRDYSLPCYFIFVYNETNRMWRDYQGRLYPIGLTDIWMPIPEIPNIEDCRQHKAQSENYYVIVYKYQVDDDIEYSIVCVTSDLQKANEKFELCKHCEDIEGYSRWKQEYELRCYYTTDEGRLDYDVLDTCDNGYYKQD